MPAVGLGVAWSWRIAETRHWSQLAHTRLPHRHYRGYSLHNHSCHSRELGMQRRLGSHRCNLRTEHIFVLYPTMQNWVYDNEHWQPLINKVTHTCQKHSNDLCGLRSLNSLAHLEVLSAERQNGYIMAPSPPPTPNLCGRWYDLTCTVMSALQHAVTVQQWIVLS